MDPGHNSASSAPPGDEVADLRAEVERLTKDLEDARLREQRSAPLPVHWLPKPVPQYKVRASFAFPGQGGGVIPLHHGRHHPSQRTLSAWYGYIGTHVWLWGRCMAQWVKNAGFGAFCMRDVWRIYVGVGVRAARGLPRLPALSRTNARVGGDTWSSLGWCGCLWGSAERH